MSDDRFKAIGMDDITMPGGWSVNDGQTFLYTPAERALMHQTRQFAQKEILPRAAEAHGQVKEIKARHEGKERRARLRTIGRAGKRSLSTSAMPSPTSVVSRTKAPTKYIVRQNELQ